MKTLLSVVLKVCDEKCKCLEWIKEIVQINYIKADIVVLKLGSICS